MNTGGPAFPQHGWSKDPQVLERMRNQGGMTLLDWFAGQALEGRAHRFDNPHERRDLLAQDCYDIATAMLAEKARREAVVQESSTTDHSGEANKMVEDHFPDATKMIKLEEQNRELVEKVKRLEEAGNEVVYWFSPMAKHQLTPSHLAALSLWNATKETKP